MNIFKTYRFLLFPLTFLFFSCEKEFSREGEVSPSLIPVAVPPVSSAGSDSTYLDKIIYLTVNAGSTDTNAVSYYNYDDQKRVSFLKYTFYTTGVSRVTDILSYLYNSSDTVPYRSQEVQFYPTYNDTFTYHFTYSPAGKRSLDSNMYLQHYTSGSTLYYIVTKGIFTYQFPGSNIYATEAYTDLASNDPGFIPGNLYVQKDTGSYDPAGNLLTNKRYPASIMPVPPAVSVFTYDNHPNPFRRLSNAKAIDLIPFGYDPIDLLQANNNRLYAKDISASGSINYQQDLTGRYSYRADGYPVETDLPAGSALKKTIFIYRHF